MSDEIGTTPTPRDIHKRNCTLDKASIIKLNIGGVKFQTTLETILSKGDNFISSLVLSDKIPVSTDSDGYIFIDRDGRYFTPILEYLRSIPKEYLKVMSSVTDLETEIHSDPVYTLSNFCTIPDDISLVKLNKEIDYYCIKMPKFHKRFIDFVYNKNNLILGENLECIESLEEYIRETISTKTISRVSRNSRVWIVGFSQVLEQLVNSGWKIDSMHAQKDNKGKHVTLSKIYLL
jgi:hypothetical protein